jgi:hypothetical protein
MVYDVTCTRMPLGVPQLQGLPAFRGDVAICALAKVALLNGLRHQV